jgi:hypothetical protein
MTQEPAGAWTRTSRIIRAGPQELYDAFMDPAALVDLKNVFEHGGHCG